MSASLAPGSAELTSRLLSTEAAIRDRRSNVGIQSSSANRLATPCDHTLPGRPLSNFDDECVPATRQSATVRFAVDY